MNVFLLCLSIIAYTGISVPPGERIMTGRVLEHVLCGVEVDPTLRALGLGDELFQVDDLSRG